MKTKNKQTYIQKRLRSFGYAGKGIRLVFSTEANMKIHLIITALVIVAGFVMSISMTEWLVCLLCMGLVISMEMMNTAIENIVDMVSPEHHPLAGKAKDVAAGAVFISAILAAICGVVIFFPKIFQLFEV